MSKEFTREDAVNLLESGKAKLSAVLEQSKENLKKLEQLQQQPRPPEGFLEAWPAIHAHGFSQGWNGIARAAWQAALDWQAAQEKK